MSNYTGRAFFFLVSHRCMLGEGKKKEGEFCPSQRLSATVDPAASTPPKIPAPSLPHRQGSSALDVGSSPSSPAHSFSPHLVLATQHSCPGRFTTLPSFSALSPLLYHIAWPAPQEELGRFGVYRAASSTLVHPRQLCGQHGPLFRTLETKNTRAPFSRNTLDASTAGPSRKLEIVSSTFASCASELRLCCLAAPPDRRIPPAPTVVAQHLVPATWRCPLALCFARSLLRPRIRFTSRFLRSLLVLLLEFPRAGHRLADIPSETVI